MLPPPMCHPPCVSGGLLLTAGGALSLRVSGFFLLSPDFLGLQGHFKFGSEAAGKLSAQFITLRAQKATLPSSDWVVTKNQN